MENLIIPQAYLTQDGQVDMARVFYELKSLHHAVSIQQEINEIQSGKLPYYTSVDQIPEVRASAETKAEQFEERLASRAIVTEIQKIKSKYPAQPGLFAKKRRRARATFLTRVDNQIRLCQRKILSWKRKKCDCTKLVVHDKAIDALELQLEEVEAGVEMMGIKRKKLRPSDDLGLEAEAEVEPGEEAVEAAVEAAVEEADEAAGEAKEAEEESDVPAPLPVVTPVKMPARRAVRKKIAQALFRDSNGAFAKKVPSPTKKQAPKKSSSSAAAADEPHILNLPPSRMEMQRQSSSGSSSSLASYDSSKMSDGPDRIAEVDLS